MPSWDLASGTGAFNGRIGQITEQSCRKDMQEYFCSCLELDSAWYSCRAADPLTYSGSSQSGLADWLDPLGFRVEPDPLSVGP